MLRIITSTQEISHKKSMKIFEKKRSELRVSNNIKTERTFF